MQLLLKKIHPEVKLPERAYSNSVGLDLSAFLLTEAGGSNSVLIPPGVVKSIPTGLFFGGILDLGSVTPHRPFLAVCSRSGLAERGLFVANAPGIVDPDYRGEIKVLLANVSYTSHYIRHGDRIAQAVVTAYGTPDIVEVEALEPTERGEKGFGSSGR